jgi:hypothetical protein
MRSPRAFDRDVLLSGISVITSNGSTFIHAQKATVDLTIHGATLTK